MVAFFAPPCSRNHLGCLWAGDSIFRTVASVRGSAHHRCDHLRSLGAWVAIAFPERLRLLSGQKSNGSGAGNRRFLDLFAPVIHSTAILCIVLLVGLAAPVIKGLVTDVMVIEFLRRSSFGLLAVLTLWQVWTVVLTLIPADELKSAMDRDLATHRSRQALRGLGNEMTQPEGDDL